jgi:hypothetical protein
VTFRCVLSYYLPHPKSHSPANHVLASSRCRWLRFALQMCQRLLLEAQQTVESRRTELEQVQRKKDSGDVSL